ncbi:GAF domain-containing protein [Nocardia amamiensis]|uniref:GAF domain-containing protein n=1 Tax=Nocardia amamiensis TaxID=404578 RepID=UPI00082EAAEB|nr:GAF domain-containing protein [Nocardia amamiensis]
MRNETAILSEPLREVTAEYVNWLAVTDSATLARRARHFASAAQFGVDQPAAMRRLHKATSTIAKADGLEDLLGRVLDTAIALIGADFGNVQLVDPATGALRIVSQCGFGPEFLDYFAVVDDPTSACGRASKTGEQTVITDTRLDPSFAPHHEIAERSRFRSVQSTPLLTYDGELIGIVSTHLSRPHSASARELRVMQLFGDVAGEAIAHRLGAANAIDPIGRAMVTALLAPTVELGEPARNLPRVASLEPPTTGRLDAVTPEPSYTRPELTVSEFAGDIVDDLFSVSMTLHGACSLVRDGLVRERLASAVDGLDETIRQIHANTFHVVPEDLPD